MIEFISQYWLEFVFGLVAACLVFIIRQYYKQKSQLEDKDQEDFKEEILDTINADICEQVNKCQHIDGEIRSCIADLTETVKQLNDSVANIQHQMLVDNVTALKAGILSVQGKIFKEDCRNLLRAYHVITEEEYEDIVADHKSYNGLGGNHIGDSLFKSVMNKWNKQIENDIQDSSGGIV